MVRKCTRPAQVPPRFDGYIRTCRNGKRPNKTAVRKTEAASIETTSNLERDTDMKLFNLVKNFRNDEDGAVTVDWVVLTAAIVGLGIVVMNTVGSGLSTTASTLSSSVSTAVGSQTNTSISY